MPLPNIRVNIVRCFGPHSQEMEAMKERVLSRLQILAIPLSVHLRIPTGYSCTILITLPSLTRFSSW